MSEFLRLSLRGYQAIENQIHETTFANLIKIADYFNCSIDYLLGHETTQSTTGNTPLQKKLIYQISQLDNDLCEIAEATIEGLYVTNQERKVMREKVQNIQRKEVAENNV